MKQLFHKLTGGRLKGIKKKIANIFLPLKRKVYKTFSPSDFREHLHSKIGTDWDILFVHSSMDKMAPMYQGDVSQVLEILEELVDDSHTLSMPAFYFGDTDGDMISWYRENPVFKAKRTPSQMGLLTELFRRRPDVIRSLHPSHSVCAKGPLAKELTEKHHLVETTHGEGTPFDVLTRYRSLILGIGVEYSEILTQIHHCEDLLGDDFPTEFVWNEVPVRLIDNDKQEHSYLFRKQKYANPRKIERIKPWIDDGIKSWVYHGVPMYLTEAKLVTDSLLSAAKKGKTIYSS